MSEKLQALFLDQRDAFNQAFYLQKYLYPHLDEEAFSHFLTERLAPLVSLVEEGPDLDRFIEVAYKQVLKMASMHWLSTKEMLSIINLLWSDIFPIILPLLISKPEQNLAAFANGLHKLPTIQKKQSWIDLVYKCCQKASNQDQLEQLLIVSLWMSGLTQYREIAIKNLAKINDDLMGLLLADHAGELDSPRTLKNQLIQGPWVTAFHSAYPIRRIGNAALLDGEFSEPSTLATQSDQIYVKSSENIFLLMADHFGQVLLPISHQETEHLSFSKSINELQEKISRLVQTGLIIKPADLSDIQSVAVTSHTVAITSLQSFQILLYARCDDEER